MPRLLFRWILQVVPQSEEEGAMLLIDAPAPSSLWIHLVVLESGSPPMGWQDVKTNVAHVFCLGSLVLDRRWTSVRLAQ